MSERSGPESRQRRRPGWFAYLVWPAPLVPGALVPVKIDLEQDAGVYVEPNVWVVHEVGKR